MDTTSHPHPSPSPTFSSPPLTVTQHNASHTHHDSSTKDDDSAVFLAATQLLELSKTQPLNGVVNTLQIYKESLDLRSPGRYGSNCSGEVLEKASGGDKSRRTDVHASMEEREGEKGRVEQRMNGFGDVEEREVGNKVRGEVEECPMEERGGGMENGEVVSGDSGMSDAEGERGDLCCNESKEEIKMEEGATSEDVKTSRVPSFGK